MAEIETSALSIPTGPLSVLIWLRNVHTNEVVEVRRLAAGSLRVGAASDMDWIVEDSAVSRRHLELSLSPGGVTLRDLKSRNGTYYLGQRVGEITLALGSRVTFGNHILEVVADEEDFAGTQSAELEHYGDLSGRSPVMVRLFSLMKRLEGSLVNVLVHGESGTGKELIARALHDHSRVASGPFLAINCGALDRSLVRSELFGHKKGAFTGAAAEAQGAFVEAHGGTLFLDEVGELPLDVQPMLLRTLETGAVTRVGEARSRSVQVRLIAATHRDLAQDVAEGRFRADLYYRLKVVQLHAPPLRARREDLPLLAARICQQLGQTPPSEEVLRELSRRTFPGNVRELKHALMAYGAVGELPEESAALVTAAADLSAFADPRRPYAEQKEALVDRMTELYLRALLERTGGNRSEAARIAELQRGYLRRLLYKYGLASPEDDQKS